MRRCYTLGLGYHIQDQGHNQRSEVKSCLCDYLKLAEANFVKLHKKVTIIRRFVTHYIYAPKLKAKITIWGQSSNYLSAITQKSTKANFIKPYRKMRHLERYTTHKTLVPTLKVKVIVRGLKVKSFLCISKKILMQV